MIRWQWVIDDEVVGVMEQPTIDNLVASTGSTRVAVRAEFIAACMTRFVIGDFREVDTNG